MKVRGSNITNSAQGLLATVIRTGRFRLSRVRQAFQRWVHLVVESILSVKYPKQA